MNAAYLPSAEELARAERIVAAFKRGRGARRGGGPGRRRDGRLPGRVPRAGACSTRAQGPRAKPERRSSARRDAGDPDAGVDRGVLRAGDGAGRRAGARRCRPRRSATSSPLVYLGSMIGTATAGGWVGALRADPRVAGRAAAVPRWARRRGERRAARGDPGRAAARPGLRAGDAGELDDPGARRAAAPARAHLLHQADRRAARHRDRRRRGAGAGARARLAGRGARDRRRLRAAAPSRSRRSARATTRRAIRAAPVSLRSAFAPVGAGGARPPAARAVAGLLRLRRHADHADRLPRDLPGRVVRAVAGAGRHGDGGVAAHQRRRAHRLGRVRRPLRHAPRRRSACSASAWAHGDDARWPPGRTGRCGCCSRSPWRSAPPRWAGTACSSPRSPASRRASASATPPAALHFLHSSAWWSRRRSFTWCCSLTSSYGVTYALFGAAGARRRRAAAADR